MVHFVVHGVDMIWEFTFVVVQNLILGMVPPVTLSGWTIDAHHIDGTTSRCIKQYGTIPHYTPLTTVIL
eukprot:scaffold1160_cov153-Amphora_coffeaeformis.AAC.2